MLRTKDQKFNKDVRVVDLMKRLGQPLPEDYNSSIKSLPDSTKQGEELILTGEGDDEEEAVVEKKKKK